MSHVQSLIPQLRPALDLSVTEFDELAQLTAIDVIALDADSAEVALHYVVAWEAFHACDGVTVRRPAPAPGARRWRRALALRPRAAAHARPLPTNCDLRRFLPRPNPGLWRLCARRRLLCADRRPPLQALHGGRVRGLHRPLCAAGPAHGHGQHHGLTLRLLASIKARTPAVGIFFIALSQPASVCG